jgi:serine/threonine protein kinase
VGKDPKNKDMAQDLDWQYLNQLPGYKRAKADFPQLDAGRKRGSSSTGLRDEIEKNSSVSSVRMAHQKLQLLERLLKMDPKPRITAKQALQHPYFSMAPLPKLKSVFSHLHCWVHIPLLG